MASPDRALLAGLDLLAGAQPQQLDDLAGHLELVELGAGETIGIEGEPGDTFWLVLRGELEITRGSGRAATRVALAGPGTLVGELAVLRGQPRSATVTTATEVQLASGYADGLQRILAIPSALERVSKLASSRLAQALTPLEVRLRDDTALKVRPLLPSDRDAYGDEIHHLSKTSLRKRFFTSTPPSDNLVDYLVDIDYVNHFAWVAFDSTGAVGLATARYVRTAKPGQAEMAFETADELQGRGIGTLLFGALGVAAVEAGVKDLVAYTQEDNRAMLKVFSKADSRLRFGEPGVVIVNADPRAAAALVPEPLRTRMAQSVHDVVTAASLAPARP